MRTLAHSLALCLLSLAAVVCPVHAHPLLDQAKVQADEADFHAALESLSRAEHESTLVVDELKQLYRQRALVNFALGLDGEAKLDLERLATLEPTYELGDRVPPAIREQFPKNAQTLSLDLSLLGGDDTVKVRARLSGLRTDLVRDVELSARLDDGEWETVRGRELVVELDDNHQLQYHGTAFGPGESLVALAGDRDSPLEVSLGEQQSVVDKDDTAESDPTVFWIIGGVALAAVVVAVIVGVAAGSGEADTQLGAPTVIE